MTTEAKERLSRIIYEHAIFCTTRISSKRSEHLKNLVHKLMADQKFLLDLVEQLNAGSD